MLNERDQLRYTRQIAIDEIGQSGQERLKKGHVAVVGAGGLGSAVGLYLAAAGCGHLTIIDPDTIERPNLNRQVLYSESDMGKKKAEVAQTVLASRNSDIDVQGIAITVDDDNAVDLLREADVIVDCLDNFGTRYVVNQASLSLQTPLVHGACSEWRGQLMTVVPRLTACLRCVFPHPPPSTPTPILGSVAGTIGTMQATEVVKLLTGIKPILSGILLLYDAQYYIWDAVQTERDEQCPQCGVNP
jgi:adenylyltransferase/sulfurtransferase